MKDHMKISTPWRTMPAWWSFIFVTLLVAALALAAPAHAAGVVGNGTPESCTEAALTAALQGGGTVTFNCGGPATIFFTSQKVITQDTVIQGNNVIYFDGGSTTRLFGVAAPARLTLNDLALAHGYNPGDGGAVLNEGTLALNNVQVNNNASGTCGGAIWSRGAVIIANSRFEKNKAVHGGGAICTGSVGAPTIQVTNSRFGANEAAQSGNNLGYGGAIFLNSKARLSGASAEFRDNKAQFGGALAIFPDATATVRGQPGGGVSSFFSNSATHSGGAIYNQGSLNLSDTAVTNNFIPPNITANGYGGGVASLGKLTIHDSAFHANRGLTGAGLYLAGGLDSSRADIQRVDFQQHLARYNGGGVFADNTTLVMTNTSFVANVVAESFSVSEGRGGGLACVRCDRLRLSNSTFVNNRAVYGGGLYVGAAAAGGLAQVESVTFSGNQATNRGGGVYNQGNLALYFSTLAYNYNGVFGVLGANTYLLSSVLHNPGFNNCGTDGTALYSNSGANHISDDTCGPGFSVKGDPQLGPLQSKDQQYRGNYFHLPLAGSPLINRGYFQCPERDQRGRLRPDACDIGAVEFGGLLPTPTPNPNPTGYSVYLPLILR